MLTLSGIIDLSPGPTGSDSSRVLYSALGSMSLSSERPSLLTWLPGLSSDFRRGVSLPIFFGVTASKRCRIFGKKLGMKDISASVLFGLPLRTLSGCWTPICQSLFVFYLRIFALFLFILETDFICLRVHAWTLRGQKIELDAGSLELGL